MTTWILCPNLRGARLFQCTSITEGVKFLREFPHPKLHFAVDDFDSDNDVPLEVQDPRIVQKKKEVAEHFMTFLAGQMEEAAKRHGFDSLLLCAEPILLEILKRDLGNDTRKHLVGQVDVDLYDVNETDLVNYVKDFIFEAVERRGRLKRKPA